MRVKVIWRPNFALAGVSMRNTRISRVLGASTVLAAALYGISCIGAQKPSPAMGVPTMERPSGETDSKDRHASSFSVTGTASRVISVSSTPDRLPTVTQDILETNRLLYSYDTSATNRLSKRAVAASWLTSASAALIAGGAAFQLGVRDKSKGDRAIAYTGAATGLLAGIMRAFGMADLEAKEKCVRATRNMRREFELRYTPGNLPVSDEAWKDYLKFKDELGRRISEACN